MAKDSVIHFLAEAAGKDCDWSGKRCMFFEVLDHLPVGVYVKDAATLRYLFRNHVNERLFGVSNEDSVGRTVHDLFPPEVAERFEAADREVLVRGSLEMPDQHVVCRDGAQRILRASKTLLRDSAGHARLIVGVFEDVTDMRRMEESLRSANVDLVRRVGARSDELERAGRINQMGEMVAGLAHEINQPLAAIIYTLTGAANRARAGNLNNAQMLDALQAAIAHAHRSADILKRIRDMACRHEPHRQALRLDAVAGDVIALCAPLAAEHDVHLRLEAAAGLTAIEADRVQIEQVLLNLVRNGIDAVIEADGLWREVADLPDFFGPLIPGRQLLAGWLNNRIS